MKTYTYQKTSHPALFRVVDREGNWQRYVLYPNTDKQVFLPGVTSILGAGFAKGPRFYEYLKNGTKEQLENTLKTAGERGDRVHQFVSMILSGKKMDRFSKVLDERGNSVELQNDEWDCILAFQEFWTRHDTALVAHEFAVYQNLGPVTYAGTVDAVVRLRKACGVKTCGCADFIGLVGLLDWKSSGAIYPEYGSQVAAYSNAANIKEVIGARTIQYTGIVRVGSNHKTTGGYEFETWDTVETRTNFQRFIAASLMAEVHMQPFDPEKMIQEIPDTLHIGKIARDIVAAPKKATKPATKSVCCGARLLRGVQCEACGADGTPKPAIKKPAKGKTPKVAIVAKAA